MNKIPLIALLLINFNLYAIEPETSFPTSVEEMTDNNPVNEIFSQLQRRPSRADCFPSVDTLRQKFNIDWYPRYSSELKKALWLNVTESIPAINSYISKAITYDISENEFYDSIKNLLRDSAWEFFIERLSDSLSRDILNFVESHGVCDLRYQVCRGSHGYNQARNEICRIELKENYFVVTPKLIKLIVEYEASKEAGIIAENIYQRRLN